jgi:hypothetical protein
MDSILLVFCWKGDQERFERHLPFWRKSGCFILPVYPHNEPMTIPGLAVGRSQQFGVELIDRHIYGMRFALECGAKNIYCTEADSICLGKAPEPYRDAVGCCLFNDPDNPRFRAKTFAHWFWSFNRDVLGDFLDAAEKDGDARTELYADRWMSWVCEKHGIPIRDDPRVYSRNQFNYPEIMDEARFARSKGVWAMHGVKTETQLYTLLA